MLEQQRKSSVNIWRWSYPGLCLSHTLALLWVLGNSCFIGITWEEEQILPAGGCLLDCFAWSWSTWPDQGCIVWAGHQPAMAIQGPQLLSGPHRFGSHLQSPVYCKELFCGSIHVLQLCSVLVRCCLVYVWFCLFCSLVCPDLGWTWSVRPVRFFF